MTTALVLMTALVPTTGHADLISFAAHLNVDKVAVLICGRSHEPFDTHMRTDAIKEYFAHEDKVDIRVMIDDNAPQNPPDHPQFWDWWKAAIITTFPDLYTDFAYVVASEHYGQHIADSFQGVSFIPYDIDRVMNSTRGVNVRRNIWTDWNNILPAARKQLMLNVTLFGQESVGKTTLSHTVSKALGVDAKPEWARPFLETVGSELTEEKMRNICAGQSSLQQIARIQAKHPVVVFDTDLFSTIGYYGICHMKQPDFLEKDAISFASDIYYLLPDTIPFCPDILRYGDNQRESDMKFWIDILEKFDLPYVIVPSGTIEEKTEFIVSDILTKFSDKNSLIHMFERE